MCVRQFSNTDGRLNTTRINFHNQAWTGLFFVKATTCYNNAEQSMENSIGLVCDLPEGFSRAASSRVCLI